MKKISTLRKFIKSDRGCATIKPNLYQILRNDERLRKLRVSTEEVIAEINIQFIHIVDKNRGLILSDQRKKQVDVLNKTYEKHGIKFSYEENSIKIVDNPRWFLMDHGSIEERNAKSQYRGSPERNLNFYTAELTNGLLGWATFPWELGGNRDMDGVVIKHSTFPGGESTPYNLGMTAVHEIGHWLGLYHTFQGGCDAVGDHVGDTTAHNEPNYGKPDDKQPNGACLEGSLAPVHNVMNYTDDDWMNDITKGQISRIKLHIVEYRNEFIKK